MHPSWHFASTSQQLVCSLPHCDHPDFSKTPSFTAQQTLRYSSLSPQTCLTLVDWACQCINNVCLQANSRGWGLGLRVAACHLTSSNPLDPNFALGGLQHSVQVLKRVVSSVIMLVECRNYTILKDWQKEFTSGNLHLWNSWAFNCDYNSPVSLLRLGELVAKQGSGSVHLSKMC